jgi:hypothetical protein
MTVFPVVADPSWTWHNAAYGAKLNRAETRGIANAGSAAGACVLAERYAGPVAGTICGVYAAYLWAQAGIANGEGECIFLAVAPAPLVERYDDAQRK